MRFVYGGERSFPGMSLCGDGGEKSDMHIVEMPSTTDHDLPSRSVSDAGRWADAREEARDRSKTMTHAEYQAWVNEKNGW